jgi:protein-S-isoprenylcysteine O-methyltransferase Ste14
MGFPPHSKPDRTPWQKFVKRARVPLGFVLAAVFLIFATPTWRSLGWGLALVLPGLWLRGYAAGYIKKNNELTRTGPYARTRNPLYLGSLMISLGIAIAAWNPWLGGLLVVMFLAVYLPTIRAEENFLRAEFAGFDAYTAEVPRLLPRVTAARFDGPRVGAARFSTTQYLHHREYNASMGAAAIYAALVVRMLLRAHV